MEMSRLMRVAIMAALASLPLPAFAQAFTVTDVAGRTVSFDGPVERIILGEGRMLYSLATLETENPFAKVVGWRNDLWTTDQTSFDAYLSKFPEARDLPFLGNLTDGTLQTEAIVTLDPDVLILQPPFALGYVSLIATIIVAPTSVLTAPLGVRLAHALPKRALEIAFGIFLLVVCSRFFVSLF